MGRLWCQWMGLGFILLKIAYSPNHSLRVVQETILKVQHEYLWQFEAPTSARCKIFTYYKITNQRLGEVKRTYPPTVPLSACFWIYPEVNGTIENENWGSESTNKKKTVIFILFMSFVQGCTIGRVHTLSTHQWAYPAEQRPRSTIVLHPSPSAEWGDAMFRNFCPAAQGHTTHELITPAPKRNLIYFSPTSVENKNNALFVWFDGLETQKLVEIWNQMGH